MNTGLPGLAAWRILIDSVAMKFILKSVLVLCLLISAIYITTPWWLTHILERQLPPGWHIDKLDAGYPGLSSIQIGHLHITGQLQAVDLAVEATGIHVDYQDFKTRINTLSLDIVLPSADNARAGHITLDDLNLPVIRPGSKLPEVSIARTHLSLFHAGDMVQGSRQQVTILPGFPLDLNFGTLALVPGKDLSFQLTTFAGFKDHPDVTGRLEINGDSNQFAATIRFPEELDTPAWLTMEVEQQHQGVDTNSQLRLMLATESARRDWIDTVMANSPVSAWTPVGGELKIQAEFAGEIQQRIKHLSLVSHRLLLQSSSGSIDLNVDLQANREGGTVTVDMPLPAKIHYQDKTGEVDALLIKAIPGLQRSSRGKSDFLLELVSDTRLVFQPDSGNSLGFVGNFAITHSSNGTDFSLRTTDFSIEMSDFTRLDSIIAQGAVELDWKENTAMAFLSDETDLAAQRLDIQGNLNFDLDMTRPGNPVNFHFNGPLSATRPTAKLPAKDKQPPTTLSADDLSMTAELAFRNGRFVSRGDATMQQARSASLAASAAQIEINWQDFDLLGRAGTLALKTRGFSISPEQESWTGFDFDISAKLPGNADVMGAGTLSLTNGPQWPFEFTGNTQDEWWQITLPPTTIQAPSLGNLLRRVHLELPASVKLTRGTIDVQGTVDVNDQLTAAMDIAGHNLNINVLASSASDASFMFRLAANRQISASGPLTIESVKLAAGLDMTHISADIELEKSNSLTLRELHSELLEGRLDIARLRFSDNSIEDTTVELSHISVEKLLAFADIDGLRGTGFLNISLPLGSDQSGLHIKDGVFAATRPGRLSYSKPGLAASNIGLQALEDFHYQKLSGSLNYQSEGAYRIGIRLEGNNPALYAGHAVVFNLTINGSLPELFEALFLTGSFEESVLKQIGIK